MRHMSRQAIERWVHPKKQTKQLQRVRLECATEQQQQQWDRKERCSYLTSLPERATEIEANILLPVQQRLAVNLEDLKKGISLHRQHPSHCPAS